MKDSAHLFYTKIQTFVSLFAKQMTEVYVFSLKAKKSANIPEEV